MNKPQINAIFPTCVYSNQLDSLLYHERLEAILKDYKFEPEQGTAGDYLGLNDLHLNTELTDLWTNIADNIRIYMEVLGINNDLFDLYFVKSFLSLHRTETDNVSRHVHNQIDVSFLYYHTAPENCASLLMHDDNLSNELFGGLFARERNNSMLSETNAFNATEWAITPKPGLLVIFPAKLPHSTLKIAEGSFTGERVGIAGDVNLVLKPYEKAWETGHVSLDKWRKF